MTTPDEWSIAQIADDFGVTHRTVRHYEDLGLLSPERRGTQRIYHRRERTRLALILRGKRLGFPLEEIRTIVDMYDEAQGPTSQLRYVLDQIDDRREDLRQRLEDLRASMAELDRFEQRCREELARRELRSDPGAAAADTAAHSSPLSG
ncbi:MerR family transcriptional regulator [Arsenicicoccus dermatophilus]|uniref:MerR family transcriptional regulator n=1 Tax=Arsenicicoccus dermatophilus TaxID=1076331 RepID=UPI003916E611